MRKVKIIGGAMTKFGKHPDRNLKSLAAEAVTGALKDAGIDKEKLEGAWVGNAAQGLLDGQEMIRGQVVLHPMGITGIPVFNVENACASSASALNDAWARVALGEIDVALVLGMEKMFYEDKKKSLQVFTAGMDVEILAQFVEMAKNMEKKVEEDQQRDGKAEKKKTGGRSIFMDVYAMAARNHMEKYGTTQRQLAAISSKNHFHSSMNPLAQHQKIWSVEEVMNDVEVAFPLTRAMCAPIGDGAAALVLCSEEGAKRIAPPRAVDIAATVMASGETTPEGQEDPMTRLARKAYDRAGIGPEDVDLAEVHDATAYGELGNTEALMFCSKGEGGPFAEAGHTKLGGKIPVNVSGGLESQGHPVGATGSRQVVELFWHLTGQAGKRQVEGAKVGLAQNGGGTIGNSEAALCITILKR
ncbi:MAG: thiolase family protein [Desulfobacterales bacterium]|nr:thiolase family protein [Desulfobacterales bacterium]